jgi:hypothetical protein
VSLTVHGASTQAAGQGAGTPTLEVAPAPDASPVGAGYQFGFEATATLAGFRAPAQTVHGALTLAGGQAGEGFSIEVASSPSLPNGSAPTQSPPNEAGGQAEQDTPRAGRDSPGTVAANGPSCHNAKVAREVTGTDQACPPGESHCVSRPIGPKHRAGLGNGGEGGSRPGVVKEDSPQGHQPFQKEFAVGLRWLHPDWTDAVIARIVGVSRRTLFRWPEYVAAKEAQKELWRLPRGSKTRDGRLEATAEEDG